MFASRSAQTDDPIRTTILSVSNLSQPVGPPGFVTQITGPLTINIGAFPTGNEVENPSRNEERMDELLKKLHSMQGDLETISEKVSRPCECKCGVVERSLSSTPDSQREAMKRLVKSYVCFEDKLRKSSAFHVTSFGEAVREHAKKSDDPEEIEFIRFLNRKIGFYENQGNQKMAHFFEEIERLCTTSPASVIQQDVSYLMNLTTEGSDGLYYQVVGTTVALISESMLLVYLEKRKGYFPEGMTAEERKYFETHNDICEKKKKELFEEHPESSHNVFNDRLIHHLPSQYNAPTNHIESLYQCLEAHLLNNGGDTEIVYIDFEFMDNESKMLKVEFEKFEERFSRFIFKLEHLDDAEELGAYVQELQIGFGKISENFKKYLPELL